MGRGKEDWEPEVDWVRSSENCTRLMQKWARQDAKERKRMVVQGAGVKQLVRLKQKKLGVLK